MAREPIQSNLVIQNSSHLIFRPLPLSEVPLDSENNSQVDLYVYLFTQKRFALFVPRGEKITRARQEALIQHSIPCVYFKESDIGAGAVSPPEEPMGSSNFEIVGLPGTKILQDVFRELSQCLDDLPSAAILKLENMADGILQAVAPDAADIKSRFMENLEYLWLMNDASAISTLATVFAAANGINSAKSFHDIVFATLVMDLPLISSPIEVIETFYRNPKDLPEGTLHQLYRHPTKAYQLARKTLPHLSDSIFELILTHHEKYNGDGYPRRLRSVQIFPLGQVFACAVEAFELMKSQVSFGQALTQLCNETVDLSQQRHRKEIIRNVEKFMSESASREG